MKEQKLYMCEICNTSFKDETKALDCENSHARIKKITTCKYHSNSCYPDVVTVLFDDGDEIKYHR